MLKLLVFVLLVAAVIFALTRRGPPHRPPRDPPRDVDPAPLLPATLIGSDHDRKPELAVTGGENNEMVTGELGDGDAGSGDGGDGGD